MNELERENRLLKRMDADQQMSRVRKVFDDVLPFDREAVAQVRKAPRCRSRPSSAEPKARFLPLHLPTTHHPPRKGVQ